MSVPAANRFKRRSPCPICLGYDELGRGESSRCYGYLSSDRTFAHCTREDFAGALELIPGSDTYAHRLEGTCKCGQTHGAAAPALALVKPVRAGKHEDIGPAVATYFYQRPDGTEAFRITRHEPKTFRQWHIDGAGKLIPNINDITQVPYKLPELLASADGDRTIFIVEGEKDCESAIAMGLVATCNPGGALKWRPEYGAYFQGRRVVVIADVDDAHNLFKGQKHAKQVVDALTGIASSVTYVELPQHDFTEWVAAGGTREELQALVKRAMRQQPLPGIVGVDQLLAYRFPEVRYAVQKLLQDGTSLLAGRPKTGKSWLLLHLALAVAYGGRALGSLHCDQGDVLYLALEDGPRRIQGRLVKLLQGKKPPPGLHIATDWSSLDDGGIAKLETWLKAHPNTRLVVVDTLAKIRGRGNDKDMAYQRDYDAVAPLTALSHLYNVCIVIVHHTRKAEADDVMDTVSGTTGLTGAVDAMIVLARPRFGAEATLSVTGRDIEEHEMALKWDALTAMWSYIGDASQMKDSSTREAILNTIKQAPYPLTIKEVTEQTGLSYNVCKQRLWQMAKDGDIFGNNGKYGFSRNLHNRVTTPEETREKYGYAGTSGVTKTAENPPESAPTPSQPPPVAANGYAGTGRVTNNSDHPPEENDDFGYAVMEVTSDLRNQFESPPPLDHDPPPDSWVGGF